jgi:glycosyltransferase involved in cell wall biosynthesis
VPEVLRLRGPGGRRLRVAHLTTVDMSLSLLLGTELAVDVESGLETFGISAPGSYVPAVEALGVRHVSVSSLTRSWNVRSDLRAGYDLAMALRDLRLDVLHTHNPKTGVLGRMLGRSLRIPVVVNTCHGLWAGREDGLAKRSLVFAAEAVAAQASHHELYQNEQDRATMRRTVPEWRSRVVGNGVDLERFRADPSARARVRAELGVARDELLVGGVGRRVAEKGIREFVEVARALAGKARFVWVGPADDAKADALRDIPDGVNFIGERQDMPDVYSALDVFALPSYREGFSRSAMEAAACGTAMVLTDIRGCREIGTHDEHLLLAPPRDALALTDAVSRLLADDDLRRDLGAAAQRRAAGLFDQRAVAAVSIGTYRAVARRRGLHWQEEDG